MSSVFASWLETRRLGDSCVESPAKTGGQSFFVEDVSELPAVYQAIQEDLRSQYFIAYQSTSDKDPDELRLIRVEVERRGAEVRTVSGYYP